MEKLNRIIQGVHSDNDPLYQPPDTMRYSLNGTIMSIGNDRFSWRPIGDVELLFSLSQNEKLAGHCRIRTRYFILTYNTDSFVTRLIELIYDENLSITPEQRWSESGNIFNLSVDQPIRSMFGFYETEDIQRIYFTDYYNQPRVINVGKENVVTITEKFTNFFPVIYPGYGRFSVIGVLAGGNLPAGNYFFCWQFYTDDGYFTDWSYLSNPFQLTGDTAKSGALFEHSRMQGQGPDVNTSKAIVFKLSGIDADYKSIRIGAFYSNDYNSSSDGVIFYDAEITGSDMEFVYRGGENAGTVTIDDLINHSTIIRKIKEMSVVSKMNAIASIVERPELDFSNLEGGKNNQIRVDISESLYEIILDVTGSEIVGTANNEKALFGSPHANYDIGLNILRAGVWYKVTGTEDLGWTDGVNPYIETLGSRFKPAVPGLVTSGSFVPIIRRKLYKINSSIPAAPTSLTYTRFTGQIRLRWSDNSYKEDGYYVYYRVKGDPGWLLYDTMPANSTEKYFSEADHTIIFEFYVSAFNTSGESDPSNIIEASTLPPAPTAPSNLQATPEINNIALTWNDNSNNEDNFELWFRRWGQEYEWSDEFVIIINANEVSFDFDQRVIYTGVIGEGDYIEFEFKIRACNEGGCSAFTNPVYAAPLMPAPSEAPSPIDVVQNTNCGALEVSWGSVLYATTYVIERYNFGTEGWDIIETDYTDLVYDDTFFVNKHNEVGRYRVKAKNSQGEGPYSDEASKTTVCIEKPPS